MPPRRPAAGAAAARPARRPAQTSKYLDRMFGHMERGRKGVAGTTDRRLIGLNSKAGRAGSEAKRLSGKADLAMEKFYTRTGASLNSQIPTFHDMLGSLALGKATRAATKAGMREAEESLRRTGMGHRTSGLSQQEEARLMADANKLNTRSLRQERKVWKAHAKLQKGVAKGMVARVAGRRVQNAAKTMKNVAPQMKRSLNAYLKRMKMP